MVLGIMICEFDRPTLKGLLILALVVLFQPTGGLAQFHRATDPVATPPYALVTQEDALAIDVNPAALGLLPSWSLAYLHSQVDQPDSWLQTGDAFFAASPFFLGLAGGISLQSIRPGEDAYSRYNPNRGMMTFALAFATSSQFSFGGNERVIVSGSPYIDSLAVTDLGVAWRPIGWLGMSLVGRDLFATRSGHGTPGLDLGPSVLLSSSFRPFGTRDLTLDFTVVMDDDRDLGGRAGVTVLVPYVGSASAIAEVERLGDRDEALRIMGGLNLNWQQATVSGGIFGPAEFEGAPGWYALASLGGVAQSGLPSQRFILNIEIGELSADGLVALTLTMERALRDPRVAGVLLQPSGTEMGLADAQEIRMLVQTLREQGKPVMCYLDSADGAEYYSCAGANRLVIDPAGQLRLLGSSMRFLLFGETLRKIGVRAEYLRIGAYKSAPEQLSQNAMSDPTREQAEQLLEEVYRRVVADLASDLKVSEARVVEIIDSGPHLSPQAVADRLVFQAQDQYEMDSTVRETLGDYSMQTAIRDEAPRRWGLNQRVGIILVEGTIIDGKSIDIPFFNVHFSGGQTIAKLLDSMAADPSIAAIVLRVDSPGGAAMASDQIWRAVRRARQRKPVIASMGGVAASGGYYIACAADEIWADPSTVTGSIGIFYGKFDIEELSKKLGIGVEFFRRGKMAGGDTIWQPWTAEQRAALADRIRTAYRLFLKRVSDARGVSLEEIDRLARGQVYSGQSALKNGLVDRLGGLFSAIARARQLAQVAPDTEVVVVPERKLNVFDLILTQTMRGSERTDLEGNLSDLRDLPQEIVSAIRLIATVYQVGADQPLALMPYIFEFQ
ncbi:MAG: signal peptide peptidase SppA [Deltaproteobacteria bacterium]|nr:signal peptide peptidase SppA [Deltaproteobacteria bacterium]